MDILSDVLSLLCLPDKCRVTSGEGGASAAVHWLAPRVGVPPEQSSTVLAKKSERGQCLNFISRPHVGGGACGTAACVWPSMVLGGWPAGPRRWGGGAWLEIAQREPRADGTSKLPREKERKKSNVGSCRRTACLKPLRNATTQATTSDPWRILACASDSTTSLSIELSEGQVPY